MQTNSIFAVLILLISSFFADVEVLLRTKDGNEIAGTLAITTIKMKTTLGELSIDADAITNIHFGKPAIVTRRDGIKIEGEMLTDKFVIKTKSGMQTIQASKLSRFATQKPAKPIPGATVDGMHTNGMSYHVRVPAVFDIKKTYDTIVLFHGSNMNSRAYLDTLVATWPAISDECIIIGINGEYRVKDSPDDNPAYNYTYVNFVGKSTFTGFPGTDRESPALVAELLQQLKTQLPIKRFFVGGHSQGGFLTYSVLMNYPDLIAGAFPIAGGVIFQCEPTAYADTKIRELQRKVPVAIVHGDTDAVVSPSMSKDAYTNFLDDGFLSIRLFTHKTAAHMYGLLPVDEAIRWIRGMASDRPEELIKFAQLQFDAGSYRDAAEALTRARNLDKAGKYKTSIASIYSQVTKLAEPEALSFAEQIIKNQDSSWVDGFFAFRERFGALDCARPALDAFAKLRAAHREPAEKLYNEALGDFQNGKKSDAYAKCKEIIDKYYASPRYARAKKWQPEK
ncbi:MAG: hypothetical protein ACKVS6_06740 [Planctomycetota bacterium]